MLHVFFVGARFAGYNSRDSELHGKSPGKNADIDFSRGNI
jgi:hypothetical protein